MPKTTVTLTILLWLVLGATVAACGRRRLTPAEVDRNRYFAEITRRADRRDLGEDEFLRKALQHPSCEGVPVWSALALANIGDPRSLPWLYEGMKSSCASVRAASAFAVGEIEDRDQLRREGRQPAPGMSQELLFAAKDPAPAVRMRAIEALGKTGAHAEAVEILKQTEGFRYDGSPAQRAFLSLVTTALMRLKDAQALPFLHRMASLDDPQIQWRAANALARLPDTTACGIFRHLLKSADAEARAYGARGLGLCGPPQQEDEAALAQLLSRRDPASGRDQALSVRVSAVQALGSLASVRSIATLDAVLREGSPADPDQVNLALQAAQALGSIGTRQAEDPLRYLMTWPSPVRDAAVIALARTLKDEPDHFFELVSAGAFTGARGERAWAAALGELTGPRAALELRTMLDHRAGSRLDEAPDTVIPLILQSMAKAGVADLDRILQPFLAAADGVALRTALELYEEKAGAADPWTPFAQAYRAMPASARLDAAEAAIHRLEPWVGEPPVQSMLREALRDPQRNVRIAAGRLLRVTGAGGLLLTAGAADTRATAATYDLAAALRQNRTLAVIETDRGAIEIELFRQDAPLTVDNFVFLARQGFYDGLTFMRVVPYFVIQGGDPRNDQEGGPGYTIRCEINMRPFGRGSVGMALSGKDTGGSQFFVTLSPQPHLDGGYTCFGQVISGMEVADRVVPGEVIRHIRIVEDVTLLDYRRF